MKKQSSGIPRYLATFADLMTLLLCFFVLLLSMAEIDALKYKVVVRSMENAFGVKKDTPEEVVKATSIIKYTITAL
jgi:chemotaxis protein MotB